jgi:hypothetical protein
MEAAGTAGTVIDISAKLHWFISYRTEIFKNIVSSWHRSVLERSAFIS